MMPCSSRTRATGLCSCSPRGRRCAALVSSVTVQALRRVDKSMRELAMLSPFTAADGSTYVAHKTTRVIAVDALSGTLLQQYGVVQEPGASSGDLASNNTLRVGRTEYTVVCFAQNGRVRWNMTYAEYAQPAAVASPDDIRFSHTQVVLRPALIRRTTTAPSWR